MVIVESRLGSERSKDYIPILAPGEGSGKGISVQQFLGEMDDYDWYLVEDVDVSKDQRLGRKGWL